MNLDIFFLELSEGELDSDNEVGKSKITENGSSNALANLMSYASDTEGEGMMKLNHYNFMIFI